MKKNRVLILFVLITIMMTSGIKANTILYSAKKSVGQYTITGRAYFTTPGPKRYAGNGGFTVNSKPPSTLWYQYGAHYVKSYIPNDLTYVNQTYGTSVHQNLTGNTYQDLPDFIISIYP